MESLQNITLIKRISSRHGTANRLNTMTALGNILNNFSWWNTTYSNLLVELCTDMNGLELGFGTTTFLGKENTIANAGVTLYTLNYNNLSNDTFNAIFGTSLENGRELKVKGRLVALHLI